MTNLADAAAIGEMSTVRWGEPVRETRGGVYLVSLTRAADSLNGALAQCPLSPEAVEGWLDARPELLLDGHRPSAAELAARLASFWLPDEVVLYVGKATSLSRRVAQYYATPLGARRPHAGGHFLKALSNLNELYLHYAVSPDPPRSEHLMLEAFCAGVSPETRHTLHDPEHPFPFANLEWPAGTRKRHGITGGREPRSPTPIRETTSRPVSRPSTSASDPSGTWDPGYRTQRVTAADLSRGQIRIPVSGATKSLFPETKGTVRVGLRGSPTEAAWDPRVGPDRERSGVLRFPRRGEILRGRVREEDVLRVSLDPNGTLLLD